MRTKFSIGVVVLCAAALPGCSGSGSSEVADNKKNAEALEIAFAAGDCDSVATFFADDAVIHQEAPDFAVNKDGKAMMIELCGLYHTAFPDTKFEIVHIIGDGDLVAVWLEGSGTNTGDLGGMKATGRQVSGIASVDVFRFKDGKVVEQWGLYDEMGMVEQAGWMEAPADTTAAE
jgi:predicted ester cyclase